MTAQHLTNILLFVNLFALAGVLEGLRDIKALLRGIQQLMQGAA